MQNIGLGCPFVGTMISCLLHALKGVILHTMSRKEQETGGASFISLGTPFQNGAQAGWWPLRRAPPRFGSRWAPSGGSSRARKRTAAPP